LEITMDGLEKVVTSSVEAALKAVNTPKDEDRPASGAAPGSNVNLKRYGPPRLGTAMKGLFGGWRQSQAFERDLAQAAGELFGYAGTKDDGDDPFIDEVGAAKSQRSIVWPKSRSEFVDVLWAMGEKSSAKDLDQVDKAIKAMSEGSNSVTYGNTAGSQLVPVQYAQDKFAYALTSTIALRQVPGVEVMPVVSNIVAFPRESTAAGASQQTEAGSLTAQDATFGSQTITVKKQYGYRQYSNELLSDAIPAWNEFLANTLVRDVALQQDIQYLEGSSSGAQIQGIVGYSGLTTGASTGTNGASPNFDHFLDTIYLLRAANAEPDFVIAHPRVLNSLAKIKDSTGNYLLSNSNGYNAPAVLSTGLPQAGPKAVVAGLPVWFSSQINIARTVGTSTDCTTVIVGQSRQVLILERQGIELAYSEHVAFANDQSAVRAIGRSAIVILQPTGVATITGVRA
jgi:HK97 family phage major capsid protein